MSYSRNIVVISGDFQQHEKMIEKVIEKKVGIPKKFLLKELNNKHCQKRADSILQICFKGLKFKIVHRNHKVFTNTISRLMNLNRKGPLKRGPGNQI